MGAFDSCVDCCSCWPPWGWAAVGAVGVDCCVDGGLVGVLSCVEAGGGVSDTETTGVLTVGTGIWSAGVPAGAVTVTGTVSPVTSVT